MSLGSPTSIAESIRELYQFGFLTLRHKSQFGWVITVLHVSIEINRSQEKFDTNCLLMTLRTLKKARLFAPFTCAEKAHALLSVPHLSLGEGT